MTGSPRKTRYTAHRGLLGALLALGFATWTLPTRARAEPLSLSWTRLEGAQSCPSEQKLAMALHKRLGRASLESSQHPGLRVEGSVGPVHGGWNVTLDITQAPGRRPGQRVLHLEGKSCDVVEEAVTLVIALLLQQNLPQNGASKSGPVFMQAPAKGDPVGSDVQPASAPLVRTFAPGLGAQMASGPLPGLNLGLDARAWLELRELWPLEAAFTRFAERVQALDSRGVSATASSSVSFDAWLAELRLCPLSFAKLPALHVCGGMGLARLRAISVGFAEPQRTSRDWLVDLQAVLLWQPRLVSRLHLRGALVLATALPQRRYTFRNAVGETEELYRVPALFARIELGLSIEL